MAASCSESTWHIELYSKEYNGWIVLPFRDFSALLNQKEPFAMNQLNEYKIASSLSQSALEPQISEYVEFKLEVNMTVEFGENYLIALKENPCKKLTIWIRGKMIVSLGNDHYLIEYNHKIYDKPIKDIRMLSKASTRNGLYCWSTLVYPQVYSYLNEQLNSLNAFSKEQTYFAFHSETNEVNVITDNNTLLFLKEMISLKQSEEESIRRYDIEIENQRKNLAKFNTILNSNLKEVLKFPNDFQQSIEKEVSDMKIEYAILNSKEEEGKNSEDSSRFSLILYSKNQRQLDKAKEELAYREEKVENKSQISLKEIESIVSKAKLQHFQVSNEAIHLLGKEKNLNDFKKIWSLTEKYNEKIQQTKIESENMKKELTTLKKQYKIK